MKECTQCHKQFSDNLNFCTECGGALVPTSSNGRGRYDFKRIIKVILIVLVVFGIITFIVVNKINNAATYIRVEPDTLLATKGGGTINVGIDYDGYVWHINYMPDWVLVDESDESFEVTVLPNTTGSNREGSITVQSGKLLAQVKIAQSGLASAISVSESSLKFDVSGGTERVQVETDGLAWDVECPDYLHIDKCDGNAGFRVRADNNEDGYYRYGYIKVYEDNVYKNISFSQGGKCPDCNGWGEVNCINCHGMGFSFGMYCILCGGRGKFNCSRCGGSGYLE